MNKQWKKTYDRVAEFIQENNRWPVYNSSGDEKRLYDWCVRTRIDRAKVLVDEQKMYLLHAIKFPWVVPDNRYNQSEAEQLAWAKNYKSLFRFLKENRRLPRLSEDKKLYHWTRYNLLKLECQELIDVKAYYMQIIQDGLDRLGRLEYK